MKPNLKVPLAGDESGFQLMEYFVAGVLLAFAVVPAALHFGKSIPEAFIVKTTGMTRNFDAAQVDAASNCKCSIVARTPDNHGAGN